MTIVRGTPLTIGEDDPQGQTQTLIQMLEVRQRLTPDQVAVTFKDQTKTFADLWQDLNRFAGYLQNRGIERGDRVVLKLANSAEFFAAFYGTLRLAATAVPIFHGSSLERVALLAQLCGARAIVTEQVLSDEQREELKAQTEDVALIHLGTGLASGGPLQADEPQNRDLAMLQYTSGTTGNPKGVMLTHENLLTNIRQMIPSVGMNPADVFVSWLPVYHDMGLITMTMCPFYLGAKLVLLPVSPKAFPWLNAIKQHAGTFTASPDFGYRFCTKFSKSGDHYDIRSLVRGLIAAEPVRQSTVTKFESKFQAAGVLKPGYGLAESSVGVSFWDLDRDDLKVDADGHISAGKPLPGIDIAIEKDGEFVDLGQPGEIVIRSASCTSGYFRNPEATAALQAKDGFIRTGDIGYLDHEGDLFIIGRKKNIIIRAGRNLAPRELEEAAEAVPGVRMAAAIGIASNQIEGELIHLFAEADRKAERDLAGLSQRLMDQCFKRLGYRPDKIWLVKGKAIPRTYNGKLQYNRLKEDFTGGKLVEQGMILFPREHADTWSSPD